MHRGGTLQSKKGFTLIELLAVIVILAIIAIIATPIVLNIINDVRKSGFKSTIDSVERTVQFKIMALQKQNKVMYPYTINIKNLNLNNKENLEGTVTIYKIDGEYKYTYNITDNNYTVIKKTDSEIKKNYPILTLKTEYGIIDDLNNYVYSFVNGDVNDHIDYTLDNYFDVENGTIEYVANKYGNYLTGSKIILKDNSGTIIKEYIVIFFGDLNGDGFADVNDLTILAGYVYLDDILNSIELFASDLNNDNLVNELDYKILDSYSSWICSYNQLTRECIPYE